MALLTLAVLLLGVASARVARADETEDIRKKLVAGGASAWPVVMKALDRSPAMTGAVLGPVFRDRSVRSPSAFAAAWLCDRAQKDSPPLLADEILRRARDDAVYVEELKGFLTRDGGGWPALVGAARKRLREGAGDPLPVAAAAWILRFDLTKIAAIDLLDAWESGPEATRGVAAESFESILAYRFVKGPAAARTWLLEHGKLSFVEWVRELSREKDRPSAPLYERMLREARANVDRAATPAELEPYLLPSKTPWVEVRQMAARRAARLEAPQEAWLPVLLPVLREEQDQDALLALLEVGRQMKTLSGEVASELAREVVRRLAECCKHEGLTRGFLRLLESVGDRETVAKAYVPVETSADPQILEAWIGVAGAVGGNEVQLIRLYQERVAKTDETSVRIRSKALEALARGAPRTREGLGVVGPFLRAVLRRGVGVPGEESSPKEAAPAARMAAVRGLEGFASEATAARLVELARGPSEGVADDPALVILAVEVLGRLSPRSPEAAAALAGLARSDGPAAVRVQALRDLAKAMVDAPEDARAKASEAVRGAMAPDGGPTEVRIAALSAAASLRDPRALVPACELGADLARASGGVLLPEVESGLERLAHETARADDRHDADLVAGVAALARAQALDAAVAVADAAADGGAGRIRLQVVRADLLRRRAMLAQRPGPMRRDDLREADRILRTVELGTVPKDAVGETWKEALSLHDAVLLELLEDPQIEVELRRSAFLAFLDVAVRRGDEPTAKRALAFFPTIQALDLSPTQRDALAQSVAALERIVHPLPPK